MVSGSLPVYLVLICVYVINVPTSTLVSNQTVISMILGNRSDPGIILFEGLAASGLRSIRYALEVQGIEEIIASDISTDAFQLMGRNIEDNQVSHLVTALQMDARCIVFN